MRNSFTVLMGIVFVFLIRTAFTGSRTVLLGYASLLVLLSALQVCLVRFRKYRFITYACLILPYIGLFASMLLPVCGAAYWFLLAVYPLIAVQLRGSRAGTFWYGCFFCLAILLFLLPYLGVVPALTLELTFLQLAEQTAMSFLLFCIALYAESRHEKLIESLSDRFVFDESTGLPDRDVLVHSIDKDRIYLFAIIKIENFSDLVALFGYEFSDIITQFASRKLLKFEKKYHYKTYQLKYNEYGILVEQTRQLGISEIAQYLNDVIKSLEIESLPWERDRINLVYRVGGALVMPGDDMTPLSKADIALKKAERGHSSITIFDSDNTERRSAYDYVMKFSELINNRENNSFLVVFQPIFTGDGLGIAWYEALLRVRLKDGSYASIHPYLEVARSTGFYQYLTDFVLEKSADAILKYDIDVSINIAIHDIVRPEFIQRVDLAYEKIRKRKGRIIFEILESDELVELDKCLWFIEYVSRFGFKIAIDDFGTGYSNYCTLVNLPIDIVKIDGSLIKKIRHDESAKILVEGIVSFCAKSNKKTVAEFVEDKEVMDSLKSMNIDFLQGYYLAKPGMISGEVSG